MGSRRKLRNVSIDRISSLPEPIICHILSFLPTTDAVKTTLLSPKFLNLWKNITTLNFSHNAKNPTILLRFLNFVNRVFLDLESKCIDKLSIKLSGFNSVVFDLVHGDAVRDCLSNWVAAAVAKNVKSLELSNAWGFSKPGVELPSCVFSCDSLEVIEVRNVVVVLNRLTLVCLPNLRILRLEDVSFRSCECVGRIVSGCSSLHTLYVSTRKSDNVGRFSVCSPTLEHLTFVSCEKDLSSSDSDSDKDCVDSDYDSGDGDNDNDGVDSDSDSGDSDSDSGDSDSDIGDSDGDSDNDAEEDEDNARSVSMLKIEAPALKYLQLKQRSLNNLSIMTSSLLIKAEVSLGACRCELQTIDNLLEALSNVKLMVLDVSDIWLRDHAHLLPTFPNLTGLTLWKFSGQVNLIKDLLQKLPKLETLDLNCLHSSSSNNSGESDSIRGYISPFLQKVKVNYFYGTIDQLKMLKYILLNGMLLKKVKIITDKSYTRKFECLQEISKFRRKSEYCRIEFY